jgi:hypothetical protein
LRFCGAAGLRVLIYESRQNQIDAVYFTGASTGLAFLTRAIAGAFADGDVIPPAIQPVPDATR